MPLGVGRLVAGGFNALRSSSTAARMASPMGRVGFGALVGGSALAGFGAAVLDPNTGFGDFQQAAFGYRDAIRYSTTAAIVDTFTNRPNLDNLAPMRYYYGRPYNYRAAMNGMRPPS